MWRFSMVIGATLVCCGTLLMCILGLVVFRATNRCNMTYMWMYPEFINVPLPKSIQQKFPKYQLVLYAEGYYAQHIRSQKLKLQGIPVLFIPGNAGSAKQVRSLGSVSLNKTDKDYGKHNRYVEFNYFAVDFDEELSALYGEYLWKQTDYVKFCVKKIFSLYKKAVTPPTQIGLLIGHSMGGLIARGVFTTPGFNATQVSVLITLATPHLSPVIKFDATFLSYYDSVNSFWTENENDSLSHLAVVSIGGGPSDVLVPSFLTLWPESLSSASGNQEFPKESGLQLYHKIVTSVDWVWASADHLCIVWCNQLVVSVVRSLFDMG